MVLARQRRHFATVWSFETVGVVLSGLIVRAATPPDRPDLLFLVSPCWLVQLGLTYSAVAADAGGMYVSAVVCYVLAAGLAFILPWAPLVVGVLMFFNMTTSGLLLFRGWLRVVGGAHHAVCAWWAPPTTRSQPTRSGFTPSPLHSRCGVIRRGRAAPVSDSGGRRRGRTATP